MKAVLCTQYAGPEALVVGEVPSPQPGPGQAVVSVKAAGVNFPDALIIQGRYQFKPEPPFSPGAEFAGVVKAVAPDVTAIKPGDRVSGSVLYGAFVEEIAVDAATLARVPDNVDFTTAAGFMLTYATSFHALKDRAQLQPGEALLVLGAAGGVGLAAVELGRLLGARVIAAASSDEKLETCRRYGAADVINYEREDLREAIKRVTGGKGVDVVYDPVGGKYTEPALRGLTWKGRHLVVGFAAGEIPRVPLNLTLLKGCSIVGVFWGDFARREPAHQRENMATLMHWLAQGKLKPLVSQTYPFERAGDAIADLMARRVRGKAVLVLD